MSSCTGYSLIHSSSNYSHSKKSCTRHWIGVHVFLGWYCRLEELNAFAEQILRFHQLADGKPFPLGDDFHNVRCRQVHYYRYIFGN